MLLETLFLLLTVAVSFVYSQKTYTIDIGGGGSGRDVSSKSINAVVGDTIQWRNVGISIKQIHQQGSLGSCQPMNGALFGTSSLFPGSSFSYTFDKPTVALFYIDSPLKDCANGSEGTITVLVATPVQSISSPSAAASSKATGTGTSIPQTTASTTTASGNVNNNNNNNNINNNNNVNNNNNNNNIVNGFPAGSPVPKANLSGSQSLRGSAAGLVCAAVALLLILM